MITAAIRYSVKESVVCTLIEHDPRVAAVGHLLSGIETQFMWFHEIEDDGLLLHHACSRNAPTSVIHALVDAIPDDLGVPACGESYLVHLLCQHEYSFRDDPLFSLCD